MTTVIPFEAATVAGEPRFQLHIRPELLELCLIETQHHGGDAGSSHRGGHAAPHQWQTPVGRSTRSVVNAGNRQLRSQKGPDGDGDAYPRASCDAYQLSKSGPKPLDSFAVTKAKSYLEPGIVYELTRPFVSISMHGTCSEGEAVSYFRWKDTILEDHRMIRCETHNIQGALTRFRLRSS
jgi:hypothetical protein